MSLVLQILFLSLSTQVFAATVVVEPGASAYFKAQVQKTLSLLPQSLIEGLSGEIRVTEKVLDGDQSFPTDLCAPNEGFSFGSTSPRPRTIEISSALVRAASTDLKNYPCGHQTFERTLEAAIIHQLMHFKDGLSETHAVNVEYLVLDPEFECRKPSTAAYLSLKTGIPLLHRCEKKRTVLVQSSYVEDNYMTSAEIDPSRVYQVHYLFAGKGKSLLSHWGHAMFRLIVCAPHRKSVGPECLEDVSHHLALSYRAYVDELKLSTLKGLTGKYPSQLFVLRYLEVLQEYTKFELRDVYSVPLKLSEAQKRSFLDLTVERFWTYQGKYYFFGNNCGTEAKKHLAVALDEDQTKLVSSLTPSRMYQTVIDPHHHLVDGQIQGLSEEQLINRGVLVKSLGPELAASFEFLKVRGIFAEKDFESFLKTSKAKDRRQSYESFFGREIPDPEKKLFLMKLSFIERYLSVRLLQGLQRKALNLMEKDPALKEKLMDMGNSLKDLSLQPWQVIRARYGVPSPEEFEAQYSTFVSERNRVVTKSNEAELKTLSELAELKSLRAEFLELEEMKQIKTLTNQLFKNVLTP